LHCPSSRLQHGQQTHLGQPLPPPPLVRAESCMGKGNGKARWEQGSICRLLRRRSIAMRCAAPRGCRAFMGYPTLHGVSVHGISRRIWRYSPCMGWRVVHGSTRRAWVDASCMG
jgi:hypothetical protein